LNENDISLLSKNIDKIDWLYLSANPSSYVIELLKKNSEKINWIILLLNPSAIPLLSENLNKVDWYWISYNPSIFELDYKIMMLNNIDLYEKIIKEVMKPSKVFKESRNEYDYLEKLFGD